MTMNREEFPDLESVEVTVVEEHADGRRTVRKFADLAQVPELLTAAFGSAAEQEMNALDLGDLVRQAYRAKPAVSP